MTSQSPSDAGWWWKTAQHLDEAQAATANAIAANVDDPAAALAFQEILRQAQAALLEVFRSRGLLPVEGSSNGASQAVASPAPSIDPTGGVQWTPQFPQAPGMLPVPPAPPTPWVTDEGPGPSAAAEVAPDVAPTVDSGTDGTSHLVEVPPEVPEVLEAPAESDA